MKKRIDIIYDFIKYAKNEFGIEQLPKIKLVIDKSFVTTNYSFGNYRPDTKELSVYIANRNLADILRTLCHELVHHRQNELNMSLDGNTGSDTENQANSLAGILLRVYGKKNEIIYENKIK